MYVFLTLLFRNKFFLFDTLQLTLYPHENKEKIPLEQFFLSLSSRWQLMFKNVDLNFISLTTLAGNSHLKFEVLLKETYEIGIKLWNTRNCSIEIDKETFVIFLLEYSYENYNFGF